jgi:hypothetical protein
MRLSAHTRSQMLHASDMVFVSLLRIFVSCQKSKNGQLGETAQEQSLFTHLFKSMPSCFRVHVPAP